MVWLTEAMPCQVKHNWLNYVLNLLDNSQFKLPLLFHDFFVYFSILHNEKSTKNQRISREIVFLTLISI